MTILVILPKMTAQNSFSAGKKGPIKMAHPFPSYMVVTPPGEERLCRGGGESNKDYSFGGLWNKNCVTDNQTTMLIYQSKANLN